VKQNDIILIIVAIFIGGVSSFFIANTFIGGASLQQQAEVVEKISSQFLQPSEKYFNDNSYNPTQKIQIVPGTKPVKFDSQ
jgi:ABC-type phosphate/phosphonate transport system permease subunit